MERLKMYLTSPIQIIPWDNQIIDEAKFLFKKCSNKSKNDNV